MDSTLTNIEQYYGESEFNHEIPFEEFKLICNSPFKFMRKVFTEGTLKDIRLQYLGVFEVSKSRVKYSLKTLKENYDKGLISEKRYLERTKILEKYESKD